MEWYRCQECGKLVKGEEKHIYEDCGRWHLKQAINILSKEEVERLFKQQQ